MRLQVQVMPLQDSELTHGERLHGNGDDAKHDLESDPESVAKRFNE